MVEFILPENHNSSADLLEEIFKFGLDIAETEMKWDMPWADSGKDIDQFDRPDTVHLFVRNDAGEIVGVSRLNDMSNPSLLSEIFPTYCMPKYMPRSATSLEHSRYLARRKGLSTSEYMKILGRLLLGVHEYGQYVGAKEIISLTYMTHYQLAMRLFKARPLGQPHRYPADGNEYMAFSCQISDKGIENTRRYVGISESQLSFLRPRQIHESAAIYQHENHLNKIAV